MFGAEELAVFIDQASYVAVNDYEWGMLQQEDRPRWPPTSWRGSRR